MQLKKPNKTTLLGISKDVKFEKNFKKVLNSSSLTETAHTLKEGTKKWQKECFYRNYWSLTGNPNIMTGELTRAYIHHYGIILYSPLNFLFGILKIWSLIPCLRIFKQNLGIFCSRFDLWWSLSVNKRLFILNSIHNKVYNG